MNSPATNRVGNAGCPGPEATGRTEACRQEDPINLRRQTHQRMAKVDDLLQRWTKQIVLTIVARLAHGFSPTANLAAKGTTKPPNPESQNARKPRRPATAFLQSRILVLTSNHSDGSIASEFFTTISKSHRFCSSASFAGEPRRPAQRWR
jgi:hypothetical protein